MFVCSSSQILLPWYLLNCLNSFDKIIRKYSLAHADDLIRFWRSKIKVTAHHQGQILWTPYLINYLSSLDETFREWPLALSDDLVVFWRSKIKGQGHTLVDVFGGKGVHVDAWATKSVFWCRTKSLLQLLLFLFYSFLLSLLLLSLKVRLSAAPDCSQIATLHHRWQMLPCDGCSRMEQSSNQCHNSYFPLLLQETIKNISFHKLVPRTIA